MSDNLAIIVPYRNREEHLKEFIPFMNNFLKTNIKNNFCIVIVEQANNEKFNRGTLINIGFDLIKDKCTYISPHDVDLLPEESDYSFPETPTHLSAYRSQSDYKLEYEECFGGVNLFSNEHFSLVNGFSNLYCGYAAEDDDLRRRCILNGLKINRRLGRYKSLHHTYDHVQQSDIDKNREIYFSSFKVHPILNLKNTKLDGLSSLEYKIIDKKETDYIHYFVDFKNIS
jgi:hypothetical protein